MAHTNKTIPFVILFLLLSCGTSHTVTSLEKESIEREEQKTVSEVKTKEASHETTAETKKETLITKQNESIEAMSANDSLPMTVKKKTEGNTNLWEFTNAKSVKIIIEKKQKKELDTASVVEKKRDSEKTNKTEDVSTTEKKDKKTKDKDKEKTGFKMSFVAFLGIAFVLFLGFKIVKKRFFS